jgi:uncharacterized protein (TIGR02145 family)
MKTKIQRSWKSIILAMISLVFLAFIISISIPSCQKEEIPRVKEEAILKSSTIPEINEHYQHMEEVCADFDISFSSTCGKVKIERGYIKGDPIMDGDIIIGYEKVYAGLTCDTKGLLWESIGDDEFLPCTGGTITENWAEAGTYVYRVKLNQKALKNSGCQDCATFKGNKFDCFMITVVEGNSGTFIDARDGHTYKWVKIGTQIWMAENLAFKTETGSWAYGDNEANVTIYGRLYDWGTAMTACPTDWHLPSDAEWKQLEMALGMTQAQADLIASFRGTDQGSQMKTSSGWNNNGDGTNSSGFSGLPGGYRSTGPFGNFFDNVGYGGNWWSITETSATGAWARYLSCYDAGVYRSYYYKVGGFSVRCVRD